MNSQNPEVIITTIVLSLLLLTSLVGNCLTIVATLTNSKLRSYTSLLVCNLAVSDFLITCINLPIRIMQLFGLDWATRGMAHCKASVAITCFVFTTSNANLFLITLDRFLGISFPLRYRGFMTVRKLGCAVFLSWTYALIVAIFPFVIAGAKADSSPPEQQRISVCIFSTALTPAYVLFIEFGTFFTSWLMMLAMYVCILRTLYVSRNSKLRSLTQLGDISHSNGDSVRSRKESTYSTSRGVSFIKVIRREMKLAKSVLIILTLYTILLVPIATIDVIDTISSTPTVPQIAINVALVLAYANPAVNPPVYVMTSGRYRTAFARLLCCSTGQTQRNESTTIGFSRRRRNGEVMKNREIVANISHRIDSEFV